MAQITGGRILFSRTVQPIDYEQKRAEVELSFVLEEGEDMVEALTEAASIAKFQCLQMVGIKQKQRKRVNRDG